MTDAVANKGPITVEADEAIEIYKCVKRSGTSVEELMKVSKTGAGETPDGVALQGAADGDQLSIVGLSQYMVLIMIAAGAITEGATVYPAADGEVSSTVNGDAIGTALTATDGADQQVTVLTAKPSYLTAEDIESYTHFKDDFFYINFDEAGSEGVWLSTVENSSTAAISDAANGILTVTTGGTDNDQHIINSIAESWLLAANKDLTYKTRVKITEVAEHAAFFGLSDTVSADQLADDTGAIRSSFDGIGFYTKLGGSSNWFVVSSNATTQNTGSGLTGGDTTLAATSAVWFKLKFTVTHTSSTVATIRFYIWNETTDSAYTLVDTQTILYSGLAEMHALMANKTGTGQAEAYDIDYVDIIQKR